MNFAQDKSDLRSRYRHQSSRSFTHTPARERQVIQSRPHAAKRRGVLEAAHPIDPIKSSIYKKQDTVATPSAMFAMAAIGYKTVSHSMGSRTLAKGEVQPLQKSQLKRSANVVPVVSSSNHRTHVESKPKRQQSESLNKKVAALDQIAKKVYKQIRDRVTSGQRMRKPQAVLLSAAGLVFVFGLTVSIMGWRANTHVEAQAVQIEKQTSNAATDDNPDETEVSQNVLGNYTVPADHPKRIMIPKTKTYARVLGMGLKNGNQLDAPKNIFDTGWYDKSAKPGSGGGAVLIDGHVHGKRKKGVFYNLKTLVQGDQIKVERGDGQVIAYEVVKTQSYPQNDVDMTAAMLPIENGKEGLNIITCHGGLDGTAYQERLVVFAVRIS